MGILLYSLFVGGRDTDYTTEGDAVALTAGVLRVQARRAEDQAVSESITTDSRLPVAAVATPAEQITTTIAVVASAEEGERSCLYTSIIPTHIICTHKILV